MQNRQIRVGIKTSGKPVLEHYEDFTLVKNMLIGDRFHWQQTISAKLPGKIEKVFSEDYFTLPCSELNEEGDNVTLINTLPLEKYLECVVGSEMNPSAPVEFLKAHAVISRCWALGKILGIHPEGGNEFLDDKDCLIGWDDTSSHNGFDVCSDDHCQRYQGLQDIPEATLNAIRETAGEVLISPDGKLVDTRYSKCCGGQTELFSTCWQSAEIRCLESFPDPWCDLSGLPPIERKTLLSSILKDFDLETENYGFEWETEISKEDIKDNLFNRFGRSVGEIVNIKALQRGPSGRISLLHIEGSESSLNIGKELWIRRLLSHSHLYSSAFTATDLGSSFRLKGKGWGHGVGLCQIGASNMALHGFSYREILSFYFPGAKISNV